MLPSARLSSVGPTRCASTPGSSTSLGSPCSSATSLTDSMLRRQYATTCLASALTTSFISGAGTSMSTQMRVRDSLAASVNEANIAAASSCVSSSVDVATRAMTGFSKRLTCAICGQSGRISAIAIASAGFRPTFWRCKRFNSLNWGTYFRSRHNAV